MDETDRLVVLKGPFTPDDLREIAGTIARIEAQRPQETFTMALEDSAATMAEGVALLRSINARRHGYARRTQIYEAPHE